MNGRAPVETVPDGDVFFRGVDMRLEPSQLSTGMVALARNMRFRYGVAETRPGSAKIAWTNNVSAAGISPWGTVHGWGVFSDPASGVEYSIVAADGAVYYTRAHNYPASVPLPSGVTLTGPVEFVQCFNVLVMFRGADLDALVMNDISSGFEEIEISDDGTGTLEIPRSAHGLAMANRLFVPDGDVIYASDILDYTRHSVFNEFRINQGSAETLVALAEFGPASMVALKTGSIHAIANVYGDLGDIARRTITSRYGCVARKSVVNVGTDLLWLSQLGVASLTLTEQNELQAGGGLRQPQMFSSPVQPLIDRINWQYAANAVGAFWQNRYYLAVPLDDAEVLREELVSQTPSIAITGLMVNVTAGETYRFQLGNATSLTNGSDTYTRDTDFVAAGSTVMVGTPPTTSLTASVRRLFKGVNNAVLVYDFENNAWSGHDTIAGIDFKDFKLLLYNDRQRLFFISSDGFVTLYEEGYEDQLAVPYMDVTLTELPLDACTFSVNGGTTIEVDRGFYVTNATTIFGCAGTLAQARLGLWVDSENEWGYYTGAGVGTWTAPDTANVTITNGVRFYSTNGIVPEFTSSDDTGWSVEQITHTAVECEVHLRGYTNGAPLSRKRGRQLTVHLQTWHPRYTLTAATEGVEEETALVSDRERSRTRYDRPHTRAAYNEDNSGNDFHTRGRQDYSIGYSATNEGFTLGTGGVTLGLHQEVQHAVPVRERARATQPRVSNDQGRIRLVAAGFDVAQITDQRKGVLV